MDHKNFNELIRLHKKQASLKKKFEKLKESVKREMKEEKINHWQGEKGSFSLSACIRPTLNKELLISAGLDPEQFSVKRKIESISINHYSY
ncbi:MAG: hypothetical protein DRQ88_09280 [Epsilonproteobacteria bacterium]|nr:MAG: hypothetical protein DRQ88_09280 [Campylobacterota bacterium]